MTRPMHALVVLSLLALPAQAEWRCLQGRVQLIVGGAQTCATTPAPAQASPPLAASQHQRDQDRLAILQAELRRERQALTALPPDGQPIDLSTRRRVQDNIDALLRELSRTARSP